MSNTPTQNKVKFGLEKVAFAVATIDAENNTATYATPIMNPGARSISMDPQGELTKWYADNIAYYVSNNNSGYEGDLEVARFIDEIKAAIWNIATGANGIQYEDADTEAVHFALLFEFKGDKQKVRHAFYNCVATRPAISSSTTEDSKEPTTESSTITASPIHVTALDKDIIRGKCYPTDAAYDDWYSAVTLPTAASSGGGGGGGGGGESGGGGSANPVG